MTDQKLAFAATTFSTGSGKMILGFAIIYPLRSYIEILLIFLKHSLPIFAVVSEFWNQEIFDILFLPVLTES
jgi:hypothetical protein